MQDAPVKPEESVDRLAQLGIRLELFDSWRKVHGSDGIEWCDDFKKMCPEHQVLMAAMVPLAGVPDSREIVSQITGIHTKEIKRLLSPSNGTEKARLFMRVYAIEIRKLIDGTFCLCGDKKQLIEREYWVNYTTTDNPIQRKLILDSLCKLYGLTDKNDTNINTINIANFDKEGLQKLREEYGDPDKQLIEKTG